MHDEFNWDHIDDIVDVYANAYVYGARQRDLERQITSACSSLTKSRPTMHDFGFFLDTGLSGRGVVQRRLAWASQHIFNMRAWAVAPSLYEKRNRDFFCPMIEQLRVLGVPVQHFNIRSYRSKLHDKAKRWTQGGIDVFLADPVEGKIVLVKGFSWSQAKQVCSDIRPARSGLDLFDQQDRPFVRVFAKSEALRSLIAARELLSKAVPDFSIECQYVLIDDADCSWNFQAHDVTSVSYRKLRADKIFDLDTVPCSSSTTTMLQCIGDDSDRFAKLPEWHSRDYLSLVPVDRPARAMMQLMEIFNNQEVVPSKLMSMPASVVADAVEKRWSIFYPANRQRHDMDGCLRAGGFVRRPRQKINEYAITPKGIARMLILKQMYIPSPDFGPQALISGIQNQAQLWFSAYGRSSL